MPDFLRWMFFYDGSLNAKFTLVSLPHTTLYVNALYRFFVILSHLYWVAGINLVILLNILVGKFFKFLEDIILINLLLLDSITLLHHHFIVKLSCCYLSRMFNIKLWRRLLLDTAFFLFKSSVISSIIMALSWLYIINHLWRLRSFVLAVLARYLPI